MTTEEAIQDFIASKRIAVVGVSRGGKKFGNAAYRELKSNGYRTFPVNPQAETIEGDRCHPSLKELPEPVDGVVVVVPPSETVKVVRDAFDAGISRVWMQQGAESEEALGLCEQNGISAVHGHCILMFAGQVGSYHRLHRWVWKLLGKIPA